MSPFQQKCIAAIEVYPNRIASTTSLAGKLKTSRLAVHSAMRSLERQGIAHSFPSAVSRWAVTMWGIKWERLP